MGAIALTTVLFTSCSSGSGEAPSALAMASEEDFDYSSFTEAELELIEAEATWMCDAQRVSSAEPDAIERLRSAVLDDAEITPAQYDTFRADLGERLELRQAVFAQFLSICGR
ncbi:MAG: hypothetical protein ACR2P0_20530 [Acidimicrobiales bacterium]